MDIKESQTHIISKVFLPQEEIKNYHIPPKLRLLSPFQGFYRRESIAVRSENGESITAKEIFWYQSDSTTEVHNEKLRTYLEKEFQKFFKPTDT